QLFAIEDSIASQVMAVVAPDHRAATVAVASPTSQPTGIETPFAPNKFGIFEGSDLQLALHGYSTVPAYTSPTYYEPTYPTYPTYPVTYGLNGYNNPYGYGGYGYGYGWGYNWPSVIIIGDGNHHGDGGHDGHHGGGA